MRQKNIKNLTIMNFLDKGYHVKKAKRCPGSVFWQLKHGWHQTVLVFVLFLIFQAWCPVYIERGLLALDLEPNVIPSKIFIEHVFWACHYSRNENNYIYTIDIHTYTHNCISTNIISTPERNNTIIHLSILMVLATRSHYFHHSPCHASFLGLVSDSGDSGLVGCGVTADAVRATDLA